MRFDILFRAGLHYSLLLDKFKKRELPICGSSPTPFIEVTEFMNNYPFSTWGLVTNEEFWILCRDIGLIKGDNDEYSVKVRQCNTIDDILEVSYEYGAWRRLL